ncbi:MAG TPA: fibronectin type III domain-containing protein [Myxococcaceae bacterium]|nr:fibronectin type III domain-containing protein [Myxococcaceae bacterium]
MRSRLIVAALALATGAAFPGVARAQSCPANVPHLTGEWMTLPYQMPLNPINATLLRSGQVLIVAGSENDARNNSEGSESYRSAVWDPTGTTQSSITVQQLTYDVFCSGTATLPDGRALVVGGTNDYSFTGDNRASFYDPITNQWVQSQSMVEGRWYATATTLSDGRVMAFSGLRSTGGTTNTVEIFDLQNAGPGWLNPVAAPFTPPLYPRMTLLPNGRVFYSGQGSGGTNPTAWIFDPVPRTWTASTPITRNRSYGTSVLLSLLPPAYTPKVMNLGGGPNPATNTTELIDLSAASPVWTPGPTMSTGRIQLDAVLLPNGKVLAFGGSVNNEAPDGPGKAADLYDPISNTFSSAGVASYSRLYHSAAGLLPDGRVYSIGSNPANRGTYLAAIEIYTPAYLFDSSDRLITTGRPNITGISAGRVGYGAPFSVTYTASSPISSAVLVRPGSVTHAFDMEQRLIGLCGPSPQPPCSGSGTLNLTSPPSGGVAPPGYYMLFLLDSAGVPSKAQWIQLSPYASSAPLGTIAMPASDLTIPAGSSVSFGTTTAAAKYSWVFPGGTPATSTAQNPGAVTFSSPGLYTTSLTVIDASGNSDPSPPTRIVTVTPATPDFHISVSPSGTLVNPGQSTTFTVTVTPVSGFTGAVSLAVGSEAAFPSGVTSGGFSPSTISGSGTSTLTMNTTTSAVPYALSLTVTGTSGTLNHTASTTLMVTLAPPTSLSATPGSGQVSLSWAAPVGASGYQVKRSTVNGGPYATVGCSAGTSFVDTGLTNGTTYYYVVAATYTGGPVAGGASANSSQAMATPQAGTPQPPTGLTATPGNTQVSLSWTASSGATSYNVKRATVSGGPYTTVGNTGATSFTNTGLTNGTTYFYVVTALNASGESGNSTQVSATPQAPVPQPPTGLTATPGNAQVSLSWTASSGATSYNVKRATVSGGPYTTINSPGTTSYTDTGLTNGTTYFYVVTAVNASGESGNSSQASATPQGVAPAAPTGLTATPGNAQVSLSWTASSGATSYNVKRSTVSGGSYATVGTTGGTSFTNTGLTNGTTYYYVVTAVNASGESGNSFEASATPQAVVPAPPTGVTANQNKPGRLSVRWTQSVTPGVTQNGIYRRTSSGTYPPTPTATIPANTQYQDNGLTRGTQYCYVVTAISGAGSSAQSNESCSSPK